LVVSSGLVISSSLVNQTQESENESNGSQN